MLFNGSDLSQSLLCLEKPFARLVPASQEQQMRCLLIWCVRGRTLVQMRAIPRVRVRASKRVSTAMTDTGILRNAANIRDHDFNDEGSCGSGDYRARLLRESDRANPTGGNGNGARRRQPLSREFREDSGGSASRRGSARSVSHSYPSIVLFLYPTCYVSSSSIYLVPCM
jgi:hypothetical protein